MLVLPIIGKWSLRSFGIGAAVTAIGAMVARPLLVETLACVYEIKDAAAGAVRQAKAEASSIRAEALSGRTRGLESEIEYLRAELASLRAQLEQRAS